VDQNEAATVSILLGMLLLNCIVFMLYYFSASASYLFPEPRVVHNPYPTVHIQKSRRVWR